MSSTSMSQCEGAVLFPQKPQYYAVTFMKLAPNAISMLHRGYDSRLLGSSAHPSLCPSSDAFPTRCATIHRLLGRAVESTSLATSPLNRTYNLRNLSVLYSDGTGYSELLCVDRTRAEAQRALIIMMHMIAENTMIEVNRQF